MATSKQRGPRTTSRASICALATLSLLSLLLGGCTLGNQENPSVTLKMSPTSTTMQTRHTQQFTVTVSGSTNTAVTWSATGGTITSAGVYTAPTTAGSYVVTATSVADPTASASAAITVTATATVSISLSPVSASLLTGGTQQFTATVSGSSNTGVTWTASGGSVSGSGFYTAPNSAGNFTVTATSVADTTKSASANITVTVPVVGVSLTPPAASVVVNGTQQFTATVTGTSNTAVTWSATGGSISAGGLLTAPSSTGTLTVRATSVADTTKSASATVTVTATPVVLVAITPTSASISTNQTKQFTASVTGTGNTAVTWSATGGSVSASGLYSAPGSAGTFTVTATSVADNSKSASATVTVTAPVQHSVTLSWTASASTVSGYNVYRGTVSGGPYTQINSVLEASSSYVDNTVASGTTYFYVVTAVDSSGAESAFSNQVSVSVPSP